MSRRAWLAVIYVTWAVAGLVVAATGAFVQADSADLGAIGVPYGLLIAIAGAAGLFLLARVSTPHPRAGVIVAASAWLVGVLPFSVTRPEGDVVLEGGDFRSYVYLFVPALFAAVLATLPTADGPAPRASAVADRDPRSKVGLDDGRHGDI